jgi:hypothetical protein
MEIPDPIVQQLGDEELESAVNLGDEDLICFTPSRTLLYRGEGLLSDESLEVFDHDVERLGISEGRRKTSFTLTYVDSEQRFTIPRDRTEPVLERLLSGVLETAGVIESEEPIEGVFRFSELALVVTDRRIVKHIGAYLWDPDYEEYPYSQVTGLDFEEGSVATSVVISVDGRPQRIKAPSGEAEVLRRALTTALFSYYEVDTLEELNATLGGTDPEPTESNGTLSSDIELDDTIDPLVTPDDEAVDDLTEPPAETTEPANGSSSESPRNTTEPPVETTEPSAETTEPSTVAADADPDDADRDHTATVETGTQTTTDRSGDTSTSEIDPADIEAMKSRLDTLTEVAKRQNALLKQQQETITQLVDELKRQR